MSISGPDYLVVAKTPEELERINRVLQDLRKTFTFKLFDSSEDSQGIVLSRCDTELPKHLASQGFEIMQEVWMPFS